MPTVIFQLPDGTERKVTAAPGTVLMQAAVANGVAGIVAECGGNASCATCHVYLDDAQSALAGEPGDVEDEMLDFTAAERRPTSRLSCQVRLSDALDPMLVHVPEEQV
ncbi:ferredoxin, 2Fe-2S [Streptomyces sp. yr375]|uniref:2Fe-2S iron-sulfur cluster-binding protein n=1 Tax=Streptomyces sp. yr375 TaxID=1761906 RepID=UPI0008D8781C|nr:2Fe-2S iron-sulfur cluster-binding protein [Streptomyces sp. yr375]SEP63128.1 ferredoxin, 2Fe-2S [Streptomyces sp. yr375]